MKFQFLSFCVAIVLIFYSADDCVAQQTGLIPADKAVVTGKLPNGFTYYIRKNTTPEKRAVLYLVNKVGSILETDEQQGLAHFLEHMAFNGTDHYPKHELVDYLQKAGVRFGADLNAYTSFDETVYQLPVSTEDPVLFKNALQILRDWAHGITLDGNEIDNERGVILEEKRQRLGSSQRLQEKIYPLTTNHSLYARRLPIGIESTLKHFSYDAIRQFYKDWYRPDLQAVIIVGDINVQKVEKEIRAVFSRLPMPEIIKPRPVIDIPLTGATQFLNVTDDEAPATRMEYVIKFPSLKMQNTDDYRESIMRTLFSMMVNNRFSEMLQEPGSPLLSAGISIGKLIGNLDALTASASLKPGKFQQGVAAYFSMLERIKRFGFTKNELNRCITNYGSSLELQFREKDRAPSDNHVREYVALFLHGTAAPGIAWEYETSKKILAGLKVEEFTPFAERYLSLPDKDLVFIANTKFKEELPSQATAMQWIQSAASAALEPYADKKAERTTLFDQQLKPGKVISQTTDAAMGITRIELSNGVKIVLKPTTFKKDEILINATSAGGFSLVSDADFYSASIAAGLVASSGIADLSALELRNILTGKNLSVVPYINELAEGFSGSSSREDMETAMQMIYLYFTAPRTDPVVFNNMIEQLKNAFNSGANSPERKFRDSLSAILYNNNFRMMNITPDKMDQLNADRAMEIYRERFADASDFTFTFVGSLDIDSMKPLLEKYLGSLPAFHRHESAKDLHLDIVPGRYAQKLFAGKEQKAMVTLVYDGRFDYNQDAALGFQAVAGVLNIALTENLREQQGGVYNVNVSAELRALPTAQYALNVTFICDPQNVEPLILGVNNEVMKMKLEGPSDDQIVKFKEGVKKNLDVQMKQNNFWISLLSAKIGREEALELPDYKMKLKEITKQSLQQFAVSYLRNDNYIRLVLLPETK